MKVAISAQGNDIDALVDPRFGRAAWFIVADSESLEWAALDNRKNAESSGGAGVQVGTLIADQGVQGVVTGNVGPNAHKVLSAAGVAVYQAGNGISVRDALDMLNKSDLLQVVSPTVTGPWS